MTGRTPGGTKPRNKESIGQKGVHDVRIAGCCMAGPVAESFSPEQPGDLEALHIHQAEVGKPQLGDNRQG